MSDEAQHLVFSHLFEKLDKYFTKIYFLDLNLEDALQEII